MKLLPRKIITRHALTIVCAGVFLFVATLGITFGMQTDTQGTMSGCPFMSGQTSICSMGVIEHIAQWKQLFTAAFSTSGDLASIVFSLLTLVFLTVFARTLNISPPSRVPFPLVPKNKPETKLFNHLVLAFSSGILNPKVF